MAKWGKKTVIRKRAVSYADSEAPPFTYLHLIRKGGNR